MKKLNLLFAFISIFLVTVLSSCSAVAGIFKAGMGVGIFLVVVVIIIIVALISRAGKK